MPNNPYQKYKNAQYETASPEQLLMMLYNGATKFARQAKEKMEDKDIELANEKIKRVQAIINELMVTLNMEQGGEVAENLYSLYEYMNRRLIQANIRKEPEIVEEVLGLLEEVKDGWQEAIMKLKQGQAVKKGQININD